MKINNLIKAKNKFRTFLFIQNIIEKISKIHFADEEVSSNDLIAFYAKEAIIARFEDDGKDLFDAYISVAMLLALINRMTTPFESPSSMDEVFEIEGITDNDILAECVSLMIKASFEKNQEEFDNYASQLIDLVEDSLSSEDPCGSDDQSDRQTMSLKKPKRKPVLII